MTQSLTPRDRFLTGLQKTLKEAFASPNRRATLTYTEKPTIYDLNAVNLWTVLNRLSMQQGWLLPPWGLSTFKENFRYRGHLRIYSASDTAIVNSIESLVDDEVNVIVLWRLFPSQRERASEILSQRLPDTPIIEVLDEHLVQVPASDTRMVLPQNRILPELAARMRALKPYSLVNVHFNEASDEIPEVVIASASRAHCRLCGTVIQPKTACVRYYQFSPGMPARVRTPQACYLHNFDCKQPNQVLMIDTLNGYAVVTNSDGEPTEVKLMETKYDPEKGRIVHKTLDIQASIG